MVALAKAFEYYILLIIYCTVSIPHDIVLTFGISRLFPFVKLYCKSLGLKSSLMKLVFRLFLVLQMSVIKHCRLRCELTLALFSFSKAS